MILCILSEALTVDIAHSKEVTEKRPKSEMKITAKISNVLESETVRLYARAKVKVLLLGISAFIADSVLGFLLEGIGTW